MRRLLLGLVLVTAAISGSAGSVQAQGTTFSVNSTIDGMDANPGDSICSDTSGDCTLRAAIMEANALAGADIINLPAGTYTLSLGSALAINSDLTITGTGATTTVIQAGASPFSGGSRVFTINSGNVTISGVTIRNGNSQGFDGGGIFNGSGSTLTLTNSTVSGNIASGGGSGGGIWNSGTLILGNSIVSDNGAPYLSGDGGGIFNSSGTLTVTNSNVINNTASREGGGISNSGVGTVTNSTISGNSASGGGGIFNSGVGTVTNSTISGNSASSSGGIFNTGTPTVTNSTITSASEGMRHQGATLTLLNTIIAAGSGDCALPFVGITSLGHNLDSDGTCGLNGTGDLSAVEPLLGPLQDNGGPTFTHALLSSSPAIDAGDNTVCPATDQRGVTRPQGAACDIGAFELAPQRGTLQLSTATYTVDENAGSATITVTRAGGSDLAVSVQFATSNGTALAGTDYTAASGTLNWANGDSASKTFTVPIINDSACEADKTVNLALSNPSGATLGSQTTALLTIVNDDPPRRGLVQFSSVSHSVFENAGSATITVTRAGGSDGAVGVSFATSDGTATAGQDYTAASGTLSWADGDSANKTFAVPILSDSVVELSETVNLALSSATGGVGFGSPSTAVLNINRPANGASSAIPAVSLPGMLALAGAFTLLLVLALGRRHAGKSGSRR